MRKKIAAQVAAPATWQDRAIAATHGNQSRLGTILLCALGRNVEGSYPAFHGRATVTSDGYVMCNFTGGNGEYHMGAFVGALDDLRNNVAGLAAYLKLNATDETAMREAFNQWTGGKL